MAKKRPARTDVVRIRCTPAEKALLEGAAERLGQDFSAWAREILFPAARAAGSHAHNHSAAHSAEHHAPAAPAAPDLVEELADMLAWWRRHNADTPHKRRP